MTALEEPLAPWLQLGFWISLVMLCLNIMGSPIYWSNIGEKYFLGLVHMGSQVPSPTYDSKSQHGGKVPTFEAQETIKCMVHGHQSWILIFLCKNMHETFVKSWVFL
jgi:hypothetical protein